MDSESRDDKEGSSEPGPSPEPPDKPAAKGARGASRETESAGPDSQTVPPPTGEGRKDKKRAGGDRDRRSRRRKRLLAAVIVLLVVVLAVCGFAWYNSTVYYLSVDNGKVALYRGLPWEFLGIEFSSVYQLATVDYQSLDPLERARVDSQDRVSKREGEQFLDGLSTEL